HRRPENRKVAVLHQRGKAALDRPAGTSTPGGRQRVWLRRQQFSLRPGRAWLATGVDRLGRQRGDHRLVGPAYGCIGERTRALEATASLGRSRASGGGNPRP